MGEVPGKTFLQKSFPRYPSAIKIKNPEFFRKLLHFIIMCVIITIESGIEYYIMQEARILCQKRERN